jgi:DNA-binding response OmpR family regulator
MVIMGTNTSSSSRPIKRVLVIDDNDEITELLKDYFELEAIECIVINDGRAGLEELRSGKRSYDFILLDLAMPGFSGMDIFHKLKEENLLESKNIVIFTASSQKDNEMLMEGAKYILRKPFSLGEIKGLVKMFSNQ